MEENYEVNDVTTAENESASEYEGNGDVVAPKKGGKTLKKLLLGGLAAGAALIIYKVKKSKKKREDVDETEFIDEDQDFDAEVEEPIDAEVVGETEVND